MRVNQADRCRQVPHPLPPSATKRFGTLAARDLLINGRVMTRIFAAFLTVAAASTACSAPPIKATPAEGRIRQELWVEPASSRDLFYGVGGRELVPPKEATFVVEKRDPSGFSTTLDLKDPSGREWGAKLGPEAQAEVVSSRIAWGIGYHQPPSVLRAELYGEGRREPVTGTARAVPAEGGLARQP